MTVKPQMIKPLAPAVLFAASLLAFVADAQEYVLPPQGVDLIGEVRIVKARFEDTLMDIARDYHLGYDEILLANPSIDRWLPGEGTAVVLPGRHILPSEPHEGIVLNVAEKRLYFFPTPENDEKPTVITHPIGVGRMDWETPLGTTRIVKKVADPDWHPPASIKQEHLEQFGEVLPDRVPAGPDNPLGPFALRLGVPGYLIHGTNKRDGVGSRVSHGCVRLYNEDITELFERVDVGTPVRIINEPVKVGWAGGELYIEVHAPLDEEIAQQPRTEVDNATSPSENWVAVAMADIDTESVRNDTEFDTPLPSVPHALSLDATLEKIQARAGTVVALRVDLDHLTEILNQASGIPVPITYRTP